MNLKQNDSKPVIRVGVMCKRKVLQAWQARCLEWLMAEEGVEISLLIIDGGGGRQEPSKLEKLFSKHSFFFLYSKFFLRSRATRPEDMNSIFSNIPTIQCKVITKQKYSEYFAASDVQRIQDYKLDFILRFGFGIVRGDILEAAQYGVWSFHHDDEEKYRGGPPCFWEIYNGDAVTGSILQRLTDRLDGGIVLRKGIFKTIRHSYGKNVDQAYFESAKWPARVCMDIRNGNTEHLNSPASKCRAPIFRAPNNLQTMIFLGKVLKNYISYICATLFLAEKWNIGIIRNPIEDFLSFPQAEVQWLPSPANGRFVADPFGVRTNGTLTILFESFSYKQSKGHIACVEFSDANAAAPLAVTKALELSCHASYPYLLKHQGDIYCIPETYELREIGLFRARSFPNEWTKVATLVEDLAAVDTTVFKHDGLWWLFCTDRQQNSVLNLFIYFAPDLFGPWVPHAANPVKSDVRSSRPAGTPFVHEGRLYRPAQDCSKTYGGRIVINHVTKLTRQEFKEEQAALIEPYRDSAYPDGIHTVSSVGDLTLIDGKRNVLRTNPFKQAFSLMAQRTVSRRFGR